MPPAIQQVDSPSPNECLLIAEAAALRPLIDHTLNCQSQPLARRPWTSPGHLTASDQVSVLRPGHHGQVVTPNVPNHSLHSTRLINGRSRRASFVLLAHEPPCPRYFHPYIQHQYGVQSIMTITVNMATLSPLCDDVKEANARSC